MNFESALAGLKSGKSVYRVEDDCSIRVLRMTESGTIVDEDGEMVSFSCGEVLSERWLFADEMALWHVARLGVAEYQQFPLKGRQWVCADDLRVISARMMSAP